MELDDAVYIDFAFVTLIFIVIITISLYFFVCYFALIFAAVAASALSLSLSLSDYMFEYLCVFVGELVADVVNINTKQMRAFFFACKNVFQNSDVSVLPRISIIANMLHKKLKIKC